MAKNATKEYPQRYNALKQWLTRGKKSHREENEKFEEKYSQVLRREI